MSVRLPDGHQRLARLLSDAGFVAADEEATELSNCAGGDVDRLDRLVQRRLTGEPLAWITGGVTFCGLEIRVDPGIYVPRCHSEVIVRRAIDRLPAKGTAIDVCTGSGAIATVIADARPGARVVASDLDERAVRCAAANGVEVFRGELFEPLPGALCGMTDVVVSVTPYVPTRALTMLQRDTLTFETTLSYDGGIDGTEVLRRVIRESKRFLKNNGALVLELGGDQAEMLAGELVLHGFVDVTELVDADGDVRGIEATLLA
ncbi:MAG: N5-glutamine methyltransferase family protein [Acidimicrobiales bacterium]